MRGVSPQTLDATLAQLVERARRLAVPGERRILGITGAPGSGKQVTAPASSSSSSSSSGGGYAY